MPLRRRAAVAMPKVLLATPLLTTCRDSSDPTRPKCESRRLRAFDR
jgi:hypothetical protein